ncbi:efflux transporter outer membrane subunit [Thalassoglobus polymorphus]|uniref:Toluene efflux pump outer membrane protein TtgI n=1 Tax=Thalassoglobus polymorphus TaxID=2527994 RepID=A0A517QKG6_9PLAN|nr:efflux transporter outer membrane subunit [Thalassoglobus polymorphus]QDT32123.1 Toluene efflux pump outer membrane protein TtgI precursor [Thalassoglobus polymorphus]
MSTSETFQASRYRWVVFFVHLFCMGCASRESAIFWSTDPEPPFTSSGEVIPPDRWWLTFGDTRLNSLIELSFQGNFDLVAAVERLNAAHALARREASDFFPDVDGFLETESIFFTNGPDRADYALGVDFNYPVDLWGEIEYRVEGENLRAAATGADYHAVALNLSGQIARTWFALIEAHAQLALLNQQIKTNQTGVELLEAAFGGGIRRSPDVFRQRQLVESTREQAVVVQLQIELLEHVLAVLLGHPPQEATYETQENLPDLPAAPATGLPAELVQRRPDVRRAFLELTAADYDFAAAVSAQYPRLNLTASLTTLTDSPEKLFQEWAVGLGGQLIGPLLDGGQRRAEVDRRYAIVQERFADYNQATLLAFRQVEDALARERYILERIDRLKAQLEEAEKSTPILRRYYFIQEVDYLNVLSSIMSEQSLQREVLSARLDLIQNRVELYLALAGSFEPTAPATLEVPSTVELEVPPTVKVEVPPTVEVEVPPTVEVDSNEPAEAVDLLELDEEIPPLEIIVDE